MIIKYFILSVSYICIYGLSIGTVSETKPLKSAQPDDLFPDWVPFKNKHGDELGKFTTIKNKVKKRLAPPINFLIRNLEPESDYFDKGGDGGSDSEDYFEKKDWSDLHRPAEEVKQDKAVLNHSALSDIDGIVSILKKESDHPLVQTKKTHRDSPILNFDGSQPVVEPPETKIQPDDSDQKKRDNSNKDELEKIDETVKDTSTTEEPVRDETTEDTESESKKAALDSVDELKQRHAEEQKEIADRAKEEELYKELFQKYIAPPDDTKDKNYRRKINKQVAPDYDEYEDQSSSLNDKYKLKPVRKETDNSEISTISNRPTTESPKPRTSKYVETGKLSVFRNPQLYMLYDDTEDTTTAKPRGFNRTSKYSAYKGTTLRTLEDEERISLVPVDAKDGEPTLFLPAKRKERKLKDKNTTTPSSTEIDLDFANDTTAADTQPPGDTSAAADTEQTGDTSAAADTEQTGDTSAADTQQTVDVTAVEAASPTAMDVTSPDAVDAASDHHKDVEPKDHHSEKGGGKEHHSEHSEEHEEHGKKAYKGHHEDHKTTKGHHDKEDHLGKYDDRGGLDKHHHDEAEHYGGHHHEEHGKKHAKYEESGKHSKGHSTKGSHDIHKKEEYEKKVEFFEEEGDSEEEEKHGGYNHEREHKKGGNFKNGNLQAGHNHRSKGETGHFDKGRHAHAHKGHKLAEGHDGHGKQHKDHFHREAKAGGKKWIYHHGSPAKTANLVVVDRRGDLMYHGPHYYG